MTVWANQMPLGLDQMCANPVEVRNRGLITWASCQKCWQCRVNRRKDLVGRCIAEARYAKATTVLTLTYGTSNKVGTGKTTTLSASILTYSDAQKWLKRLRAEGYPLRYLLAGEYGSLKGRCHWHVICFWQDRVPEVPGFGPGSGSVKWWHDPFWTKHPDSAGGYVHWQHFDEGSAAYVCKYLFKDEEDKQAQSIVKWSKHPVLGAEFFKELAGRYVQARLLPQERKYSFADVIDPRTRLPRVYYMNDATLDYFLAQLSAQWVHAYGEHPLDRQHSDLIMQYMDRNARRLSSEALEQRKFVRAPKGRPVDPTTGEVYPLYWHHGLNTFVTWAGDMNTSERVQQVWTLDKWGNRTWQDANGPGPAVKVATKDFVMNQESNTAAVSGTRLTSAAYRKASNGG